MKNTDDILWYILSITGLNFLNLRQGFIAKFFKKIFTILCAIALSYYAIVIFCFIKIKLYRELILCFLLPINSGIMWLISFSKRKAISNIVLEVYRQQEYYIVTEKSRYWIIIFLIIIGLVLPCLECIYNQITLDIDMFHFIYLTLGYKLQPGIWQKLSIFCVQFAEFLLKFSFTTYLAFCICVLFYRCAEILTAYNTFLRIQLYTANKWDTCNYAEFFYLVNLLRKLDKTFTHLAFYIILHSLEGIFEILLTVSLQYYSITIDRLVHLVCFGVYSVSILVCFTISSSMISENLLEIRRTVRNFINSYGYSNLISKQNLFYLMRIETEDIVQISVCGMFHLTRSYILSAFGLVLTYGLLIINLKF